LPVSATSSRHAYFAVDDSIVWDAAANKAPQFLAACRRLLGEQ
jgi:uncharacterized protein with HEPN domain